MQKTDYQTIGVYLKRGFGNVRYRVLGDLGSNDNVCCVVEIYYPKWAEDIRVGVPWSVVRRRLEKSADFSRPPLGGAPDRRGGWAG